MAEERLSEGSPAGRVSAEEEIRTLERRLEEKKRELAERGSTVPPEKEVIREVVREHIESVVPARVPPVSHAAPVAPSGASPSAAHDDAVQNLVAQALSGTIADAVDTAYRESPYLLDALHDRLVDEYYDKLLALRKIDAW
ncbi:MAG: hypothetical protein AAB533_01095 [Patescibacteria group bacterium]